MLTPVYSASAIKERVANIAEDLNKDFSVDETVHVIVTLNGSFMFAADLLRLLKFPVVVHFAGASSYLGTETQNLRIDPDSFPKSFGNKPVILIEDVVDTGKTLGLLRQIIADRFAGSIKVASLLKRQGGVGCDYHGFTIPKDMFVVGYGMDMDGRYRELPDLRAIGSATKEGLC